MTRMYGDGPVRDAAGRRSRGTVVAWAVVAVVVVCCVVLATIWKYRPAPDLVVQQAGGSTLVAVPTEPEVVMAALTSGRLVRTDDGCLAIDVDGSVSVVIFPYGTELAADGQSVVAPREGRVRVGDSITIGGGYQDPPPSLPAACAGGTAVWYWQ